MGLIKKTFAVGIAGSAAGLAYLGATNKIITPIPASDPLWTSSIYAKHNPSRNPATQDVCVKRIPLSKIRPELIDKPESLVLEYCRGVWSGLGYEVQRRYLERKYRGPSKQEDLWTTQQLSESTYDKGTYITDHFEVVEKTPTAITVRCGDSPRNKDLRPSDGLFVIGAVVDKEKGEVELTLKSLLFTSVGKIEGTEGPMPGWMVPLHQWYARLWSETGSRRLLK